MATRKAAYAESCVADNEDRCERQRRALKLSIGSCGRRRRGRGGGAPGEHS